MRFLTITAAAVLLTLFAAAPAGACGGPSMHTAKVAAADLSAAAKKKPAAKKEKVEYMRSAS
jgi:hypothetical protein